MGVAFQKWDEFLNPAYPGLEQKGIFYGACRSRVFVLGSSRRHRTSIHAAFRKDTGSSLLQDAPALWDVDQKSVPVGGF